MKTNILHTLIITTIITTLHIHAMEYVITLDSQNYFVNAMEKPFFSQKPDYEALPQYELQLKLPNDVLDKIIAYSSHSARHHLKETCKQLSVLASINRLNTFIAHNFNIGDEKEKSAFFTALIKNSNPDLITTIMRYAKQEAELYNFVLEDAVCIDLESTTCTQRYIQKYYLDPLLEKALKQDNTIMIEKLEKEGSDPEIITIYKEDRKDCIAAICLVASLPIGILGIFSFLIYLMITK
jgi:hypothetical protein